MIIMTRSGETWDSIAYRIWGKGADQAFMSDLIDANPQYVEVAVFPANIEITVPDVEDKAAVTLPPWRR